MLTVGNLLKKKYRTLNLEGMWEAAIGTPELTGSWSIYGDTKNGKTTLAMELTKYLSEYKRVLYDSVEEGTTLSFQKAVSRARLDNVNGRVLFPEEPMFYDDLTKYLKKPKSPDIIVIDTTQFMELNMRQYKELKHVFSRKLFIYISHIKGGLPEGVVAQKIWRDSNVVFRVEGFKAFPISRFGGGEPVVINKELALKYWGV